MIKKLLFIIVPLVVIGAGVYFGKDFLLEKFNSKSELKVDSQTTAIVYLDGENKGKTPFKEKITPGEYEVKITPEESSLYVFNQKVKINAGTQTYINFLPASSEANSSWDIITLEKTKKSETEISIGSSVDAAEVFFDGEKKGTTPLAFQNAEAGDHEVRISASGYFDNPVKIKITSGYKLSVNSHLAATSEKNEEEAKKDESTSENKQMIVIKETPTGWLRVRSEASTGSEEVGRVNPDEKYALLEEKEDWYKIEYEKGKEGWISRKYAEKVE